MPLPEGAHRDLLRDALATEARGQRALFAGEQGVGADLLRAAAALYRASWEVAPPASYGRLIGMLKAAIIAGDGRAEATYARSQIPDTADSPPARYAVAIAALVEGDDATARAAAAGMHAGSPAFGRAAAALTAIADGDARAYAVAVGSIVADFEGRDAHVTGVPIADTALMLESLAATRGLASHPESALLPASL